MNRTSIDLLISLSLVLLTLAISLYAVEQPTIEIQLHDTYFILDRLTLSVLILGPLIILIFLPLAATRKFRSIGTNITLIVGLLLVAVICYSVAELQSSYINQLNSLDGRNRGPDDSGSQSVIAMRGLLALIGLSMLVLIFRTVKFWKEAHSRPSL